MNVVILDTTLLGRELTIDSSDFLKNFEMERRIISHTIALVDKTVQTAYKYSVIFQQLSPKTIH